MEKNTAIKQVTTLNNQVKNLTYDLRDAVVSAVLDNGASWVEVGAALGISKQTAHARYSQDVSVERGSRKWAEENPEKYAAAVAKGAADAQATLDEIRARVWTSTPKPSKISDADVAGTSETPSIFSDAAAPATEKDGGWKMKNGDPYTPARTPHTIPDPDTTAQPGTGKGPHQCPGCGDTNHKTQHKHLAVFNADCTPTKYDPPKIAALIQETNA